MDVDRAVQLRRHRVFFYDRGGFQRIPGGELRDITQIDWARDRDATSEASVTVSGPLAYERQQALVRRLISKRHEMVIFRDGKRVWEGPLWRITDEGDSFTFVAKDVTIYLFGTPLTQKYDNSISGDGVTTVTARIGDIIDYELTHGRTVRGLGGESIDVPAWEDLDPPANIAPHLTVHPFVNEAETSAVTIPYQMTVGEHLTSLGRTKGIDWTALGRAIHIWDTSRRLGRTRPVTAADFYGKVITTEYGADHTQIAYAATGIGAYGEAGNPENLDVYGPWSTVYTTYDEEGSIEPTQSELNSQAARNVTGRSPVPVEVRVPDNSTVRLSPGFDVENLVPGVHVPLLATLNARKYSQLQKIDYVRVIENADGERVQLTLTPASSQDSDEVEE